MAVSQSASGTGGTFALNPSLVPPAPMARVYTELRITNLLLCRMVVLLTQLVGPVQPNAVPAGSVANNTPFAPADPSLDLDALRNDPEFQTQ